MAISNIDWDKYFTSLDYKANIDANNFSKPGKNNLTTFGMPSDKYIDISSQVFSEGQKGTRTQAMANGYLYLATGHGQKLASRNFISVADTQEGHELYSWSSPDADQYDSRIMLPIQKGKWYILIKRRDSNVFAARFIYAEGEI